MSETAANENVVPAKKVAVGAEQADHEFTMLAEDWDIFVDSNDMTEEDVESFEKMKAPIIRAIMRGRALVNLEDASITYKLKRDAGKTKTVVFTEPTGAAWVKMDENKGKKANNAVRINKFLSEATGVPSADFPKMVNSDYVFCQSVAVLFLGQ